MARGDTAPPRKHFAEEGNEPVDTGPKRRLYPCLAHGCPMAGTVFLNGHDSPGICAWHFGCNGSDLPKITTVLRNWACLVDELELARRFTNDPLKCADVKADAVELLAASNRLHAAMLGGGWGDALKAEVGERYGEWAARLTRFLAQRVKSDVMGTTVSALRDSEGTLTVRDMLTRVRGAIGNAGAAL